MKLMVPLWATATALLIIAPAVATPMNDPPVASTTAKASPFTAGTGFSGWIPFEFFGNSRIFIPAKVNGVATKVMLDSGASETVIDVRFVKKLKMKETGNFSGQGAGGSAAYTELHGVNIELGAIVFRDTASVGIDMSAVEKQVGHDLPVVLGGDVFAQCVVDIDFPGHRIAFRDPSTFKPPLDAKAAAVTKAGENFAIQAVVEGRPAKLVFDIGNASPLNLYAEFWERPGFIGTRPISTTKNGGLGGMHVYKLADLKAIDVGGTEFTDIPAILEGKNKDVAADGNIGLPLLRRFRLLIDLPHSRVLFASPVDTKTPFDTNHSGLTLAPDPAGAKVLYVAPGSPGETAGLKADDIIVTIDGVSVKDWEIKADVSKWIYAAPGQQVRIGLLDGKERPLTFAKYF